MDEMIKKAIEALESSNCNEIELTDSSGLRVKVVKTTPIPYYTSPWPYQYPTYPTQYPPPY